MVNTVSWMCSFCELKTVTLIVMIIEDKYLTSSIAAMHTDQQIVFEDLPGEGVKTLRHPAGYRR